MTSPVITPAEALRDLATLLDSPARRLAAPGLANMARAAIPLAEAQERCVEALRLAEEFIANGIELGFIRMPDADTPDPAHKALPTIRAALAALQTLAKES